MSYLRVILLCLLLISLCSCDDESTNPDTISPASIKDLSARSTAQEFHLRWTAPGDDGNEGQAGEYAIRYAAGDLAPGWDSALVVPSPPTPGIAGSIDSVSVLGIGKGPWEFGIKTVDEAGNWSGLSNIVTASIDTNPPSAITDLSVRSTGQGSYLRWTAPSDNGSTGRAARYDVRYALSNLVSTWESALVAPSAPIPGIVGHADSVSVLGIGWGPWEFGIKAADETGNWSTVSNIVTTTIPEDTEPPAPITDLAVDLITEASVVLRWTATGDDGGIGRGSAYDLRYAQAPITPDTWTDATRVQGLGIPRQSGERELFTAAGLQQGPTYHFAVKVWDEIENVSDLSNQVNASISSPEQLTFETQFGASDPDWSPNGKSLAFGASWLLPGRTLPEIYVIPATGGSSVRFSSAPDGAGSPAWSPDGSRFALSLRVDGGSRTVLALMDALPEAPSELLADHGTQRAGQPRWSPDGTQIVYTATTINIPNPPISEIYKVSSSGGIPERLTGGWSVSGLCWSPDGTQIVYSSNETGTYHLWVMPLGGGAATQLTTGSGSENEPAWSPDGSKIAYTANGQIWVIYASGENVTQVTFDSDKSVSRKFAWSPDGGAIAYGAREDQVSNVWILRVR